MQYISVCSKKSLGWPGLANVPGHHSHSWHHDHVTRTIPLTEKLVRMFAAQIFADLNVLNAVLAIDTWMRLCGLYVD